MNIQAQCVSAYRKHRHLKVAASEVGIPWQTLYWHLGKAGEPVVGDKSRYGSDADRLAAKSEAIFQELVPNAVDMNRKSFQAKHDFEVGGKRVDVKSSTLRPSGRKCTTLRWSFSLKKQELTADFFVCFGFDEDLNPDLCLLIPGEIARHYTSIGVPKNSENKWTDYRVSPEELNLFFELYE